MDGLTALFEIGVSLVGLLIWPVVILVALLVFHRPLSDFLSGAGSRLTRLSAFDFSIELVELPRPPEPFQDPTILQASEMAGGDVDSTAITGLFSRLSGEPWDYLVVDIKDGEFWFISRVYIFTVILLIMRRLKCVVFVESKDDHRRRLIGVASPQEVRTSLGQANSWLDKAFVNAMVSTEIFHLHPSLSSHEAGQIIHAFLADKQMRKAEPPKSAEWTQLGNKPIWEHTRRLDYEQVNTHLRKCFYEWDDSRFEDSPGAGPEDRMRNLVLRKSPYIALVNSRDEFLGLIDRGALVDAFAKAAQ